jgi:predicted glycogen debranching enzyme
MLMHYTQPVNLDSKSRGWMPDRWARYHATDRQACGIQALWRNALYIASHFSQRRQVPFKRGCAAFQQQFWNAAGGYLYDVVDVDHQPGTVDPRLRPNQILAIGGLPIPLIEGNHAKQIVEAVEQQPWTPLGLRSLAPYEPGYTPRCTGGYESGIMPIIKALCVALAYWPIC